MMPLSSSENPKYREGKIDSYKIDNDDIEDLQIVVHFYPALALQSLEKSKYALGTLKIWKPLSKAIQTR